MYNYSIPKINLCICSCWLSVDHGTIFGFVGPMMLIVLVSLLLPNRVAIIHAPHNYSIIYLHNNLDQCHIFNACTAHTLEEQERRA